MRYPLWKLAVAGWCVGLLGCGVSETSKPALTPEQEASTSENASTSETGQMVDLRIVDEDGYLAEIDKHKGSPILVDCWATWCPPCVELFPHTVEMHHRFADQGLVVISLSLNYPDEANSVKAFLNDQKATCINLISQYKTGVESIEAFSLEDGALPHFKLFGRDGKLVKTFIAGTFSAADLDRAVEEFFAQEKKSTAEKK